MDVDTGKIVCDNRFISVQLMALGKRVLANKSLTSVQAHALLYILEHADEGVSFTDLRNETGYSMAATSGLVKRLRDKGYIRVEICKHDERCKMIYVTEDGAELSSYIGESMKRLPSVLFRGFSSEELAMLDSLQKRMMENLSLAEIEDNEEVSEA